MACSGEKGAIASFILRNSSSDVRFSFGPGGARRRLKQTNISPRASFLDVGGGLAGAPAPSAERIGTKALRTRRRVAWRIAAPPSPPSQDSAAWLHHRCEALIQEPVSQRAQRGSRRHAVLRQGIEDANCASSPCRQRMRQDGICLSHGGEGTRRQSEWTDMAMR